MADEKRLIDANVLSGKVEESKHNNPHPKGMLRVGHRNEHDHFLRMIHDAPTVDAVEVVRCKDCDKISPSVTPIKDAVWCREFRAYMPCGGFCSYGERRVRE